VADLTGPELFSTKLAFSSDGTRLYINRNRPEPGRWISIVDEFDATRAVKLRTLYEAAADTGNHGSVGGADAWAAPLPSPDGTTLALLRQVRIGERRWRDAVEVLDLKVGALVETIPLGDVEAHGDWLQAEWTADGRFLHVLHTRITSSRLVGASHTVIDVAARQNVSERAWDAPAGPSWCFGWHLAPDGGEAYCPTWRGERFGLEVLAAPDWEPVALVPLPNHPRQEQGPGEFKSVYSPDGRWLFYVAGWGQARAVVKVDLHARRLVASAPLAARSGDRQTTMLERLRAFVLATAEAKLTLPASAVLSPDGQRLYVSGLQLTELFRDARGHERSERGDGIWVLDTADLRSIAHFLPGREFWGDIVISPDGRRLYAADWVTASLTVIDAESGAELATWQELAHNPATIERVVTAVLSPR
jgi:DNA-binding beta-propeller fold protein YncE